MNKEDSIRFAGLMEDFLNLPSFVCEHIEQALINEKYKEVVEYVIQRRNEIESKEDYISEQQAINMWIKKLKEKDKEIERLKENYERVYNENCKLREQHNITDISLLDENNRLNNIINECSDDILKELEEKERRIKDVVEYIRKTDTLFDFIEDKNIGIDNCVCVSDGIHRTKIIGMLIGE